MRKKTIFVLLFISICFVFAYSQSVASLDQSIENGNRYLSNRFPKGTRAAVVSIKTENPELGEFVLKKINGVLVNSGWFTVVERNQSTLDTLSREMNYQMSGNVSEETELSIGKQLGAEIIISGSFVRSGQNWRLDLQALRVESAQIGGQWSAENIRPDPAFSSLISSQSAGISFSGDDLSGRDKQTIIDGLRNAMQTWKTVLEIDEHSSNQTGYSFSITVYKNKLPSGLLQAEITVAFLRNGRVVVNPTPYNITEMNDAQLVRRIVERIKDDRVFFTKVNEVIR